VGAGAPLLSLGELKEDKGKLIRQHSGVNSRQEVLLTLQLQHSLFISRNAVVSFPPTIKMHRE
jgi:hypothetical protein